MMLAEMSLGQGGTFTPESLSNFGDALHTIQDFTSPAHTGDTGEPYIWRGPLGENIRFFGHFAHEFSPAVDWSRFGWAIRLTMAAYLQLDPVGAGKHGLTSKNFDSEASKRIGNYVDSFYNSTPSFYNFEKLSPVEVDAARQCALGNGTQKRDAKTGHAKTGPQKRAKTRKNGTVPTGTFSR
jgi:hypothetical protein